jgi:GNAT superfamily N-acetyltransferase
MDMIRQFRPEDAQSCCSLIYGCLDADLSISSSLRRKLREGESPQIMEERAKLFYLAVYESESRIVGLAGLDLNEIRLMYVSPERRKSGIGRALFNHIAAMAPGSFFSEIFVYAAPQAIGFYKALGFIEKGPVSFHIGDGTIRTIFMTCPTSLSSL